MTPGQIARKLLGPAFQPVGEFYRRIFVDMPKIADWMALQLPPNARVLDIGGGDGYFVELLLTRRPDVRVTMIDIASRIGTFVGDKNRSRLVLLPATGVAETAGSFDALTLTDVVHHVPVAQRDTFFEALSATAVRAGARIVLVKDLRPSGVRAALGLLSDRYITGDRAVAFAREEEINLPRFHLGLSAMPDFPNYCLRFDRSV